jgi:hypothetical protein
MTSYQWTTADMDALVAASAATSPPIQPSNVALVCLEESGFDPHNPGPVGAQPPVGGLNQMSSDNLSAMGLTRAAWLAMSAAEQIPHMFAFWTGLCARFRGGVFASDAGDLLALNFLPGAYKLAHADRDPNATIAAALGPYAAYYRDNIVLDPARTGAITVNTCRDYLGRVASSGQLAARWASLLTAVNAASARAAGLGPGGTGSPPPKPPPKLPPSSGGTPPLATHGAGAGAGGVFFVALLIAAAAFRGRS